MSIKIIIQKNQTKINTKISLLYVNKNSNTKHNKNKKLLQKSLGLLVYAFPNISY